MKLETIINSEKSLNLLADRDDIPSVEGFRIGTVLTLCRSHIKNYHEIRNNLMVKYGEKVKEDKEPTKINQFKFTPETGEKFNKEVNKMLDENVKLSFNKVDKNKLIEAGVKLKPVVWADLDWIWK